jgi:HSP20 family protein
MAIKDLVGWSRRSKNLPVRHEAAPPVVSLQQEVNRLFDRFFDDFDLEPSSWRSDLESFHPRVDVSEADDEIEIRAELPGVDEKDIEVSVSNDAVTLKGEKREEKEEKHRDYYRREQSYGSFHRVIPLGGDVDADKAEASFKHGVLKVTLPKSARAQKKKITVESR